jgi:hypothetical protein
MSRWAATTIPSERAKSTNRDRATCGRELREASAAVHQAVAPLCSFTQRRIAREFQRRSANTAEFKRFLFALRWSRSSDGGCRGSSCSRIVRFACPNSQFHADICWLRSTDIGVTSAATSLLVQVFRARLHRFIKKIPFDIKECNCLQSKASRQGAGDLNSRVQRPGRGSRLWIEFKYRRSDS